MLGRFYSYFSEDIAIDLGTANSLVYVRGRGIVISEPSVVAINQKTGQVLAIGSEAKKMVGRTPAHIVATRPLVRGVISDFEVTEQMLRYFIDKVHQKRFLLAPRPRVIIGVPCGVTEVERKAVIDAAKSAGAGEVFLIEEPMAAAIGARLPVQEAGGNFIVDIGGGTTEVAVISLGGIVLSKSLRIAGDKLSEDIINFSREEYKLVIGERTAEAVKLGIGSAYFKNSPRNGVIRNGNGRNNRRVNKMGSISSPRVDSTSRQRASTELSRMSSGRVPRHGSGQAGSLRDGKRPPALRGEMWWRASNHRAEQSGNALQDRREMPMRGRNIVMGLPEEISVTQEDIKRAMEKSVRQIVDEIKITVEETPPELLADIMSKGIYLSGGGALLRGLDALIARETKIPTYIVDDPLTAVVRGAGIVIEHVDELHDVLVEMGDLKPPR